MEGNGKNALLSLKKIISSVFHLRLLVVIVLIIVLLVSSLYIIKGKEIAYAEDNEKNVPANVASLTNNISIDQNGGITSSLTVQQLWNQLVENESNITKYLDSAEDLSKLINAQIVTQYMDTREEPDDEIKWDDIFQDVDSTNVQGIIKMKRADSEGNEVRMTYASRNVFDSYLEEYNYTGSAESREFLRTHFTLEEVVTTEDGNNQNVVTSGKQADVSAAIVNEVIKKKNYGLGAKACQAWVGSVYEAAGFGYVASGCCAFLAGQKWGISSDFSQIVNGAAVWTGEGSYRATQCSKHKNGGCGHAGIYYKDENGNDWVLHLVNGNVKQDTLQHWLDYYGKGNKPVWGWQGGIKVEMQGETTPITTSNLDNVEIVSTLANTESVSTDNSAITTTESTAASINNFLFIGDSILNGLKTRIEQEGATVVAEVGKTAQYFVDNWDTEIGNLSISPSGIYLILGQNSCGYGNYQSGVDGLKELISKLQTKFPNVKIYVNSVLPTKQTGYSGNKNYTGEQYVADQKKLNEELQKYCLSTNNVDYVNVLNEYQDEFGYAKSDLTSDGLHPNSSGYDIIFKNIKSGVTGIGSGLSSSAGSSGKGACALIAVFEEVGYSEETNDEEEDVGESYTQYHAEVTKFYYQNMTSGYTMPFNYLWTWLVLTENKNFAMDLADLVYESEIEFTVYEKYNGLTTIEEVDYTRFKEVNTYAYGEVFYNDFQVGEYDSGYHEDSEYKNAKDGGQFYHLYKTTTNEQMINVLLTTADVWMCKYELDYESAQETDDKEVSDPISMEDEKVVSTQMFYGVDGLDDKNTELGITNLESIRNKILDDHKGATSIGWNTVKHTYHETKVEQSKTTTTITKTYDYVSASPTITEKVDPNSDEPNFVTLYIASQSARQAVRDLDSWLYTYLNMNDDTKDLVDLTKYLIYKAEGKNYGITEFNFEEFKSSSFISSTTISGSNLTEKVWNALSNLGYSDIAVAGAMGNIHYESGSFSPSAVEKEVGDGGIGLIQWSAGRDTKLIAYAKSKNVDWTDEDTQIEFLIAEISGQGPASQYADVRRKGYIGSEGKSNTGTSTEWANSTTIEDSTLAFMRFFESPSDRSSYGKRLEKAYMYYKLYHDLGGANE